MQFNLVFIPSATVPILEHIVSIYSSAFLNLYHSANMNHPCCLESLHITSLGSTFIPSSELPYTSDALYFLGYIISVPCI